MKQDCRKAERKWRKTKLETDSDIDKDMLQFYKNTICKAGQSFFSSIINKSKNNAHTLYLTVVRLTNPTPHLAPELLSAEKCVEPASFFKSRLKLMLSDVKLTVA